MRARGKAILFLPFTAFLIGCDNESPTALTVIPPAAATLTPVPSANLTGTWTGTVSESGATDESFCPPTHAAVTVAVVQIGSEVSFNLQTTRLCSGAGVVTFQGNLTGGSLSGQLRKEVNPGSCVLTGAAFGASVASQIRMNGNLRGSCGSWNAGIDLTR